MLDAGAADKMTAEIASYYHWGDMMPEVIVIGPGKWFGADPIFCRIIMKQKLMVK